MSPEVFFRVLKESLASAAPRRGGPTGALVFQVEGLEPRAWTVQLDAGGCRVQEGAAPEPQLTVYCDSQQLEQMMRHGVSERPLRVAGDRALLDALAELMRGSSSWLDVRAGTFGD